MFSKFSKHLFFKSIFDSCFLNQIIWLPRPPNIFQNVEEDLQKGRVISISSESSKIHLFINILCIYHCVKSVQIRSFSGPYFPVFGSNTDIYGRKSPYSVRIQENTDQKKLRIWTLFTQCTVQTFLKNLC